MDRNQVSSAHGISAVDMAPPTLPCRFPFPPPPVNKRRNFGKNLGQSWFSQESIGSWSNDKGLTHQAASTSSLLRAFCRRSERRIADNIPSLLPMFKSADELETLLTPGAATSWKWTRAPPMSSISDGALTTDRISRACSLTSMSTGMFNAGLPSGLFRTSLSSASLSTATDDLETPAPALLSSNPQFITSVSRGPALRSRRYFSEDSGVSSGVSSTSGSRTSRASSVCSVTEEDALTPVMGVYGTVASVLAAGAASDSEAELGDSDYEESDDAFEDDQDTPDSLVSQIRASLKTLLAVGSTRGSPDRLPVKPDKVEVKAMYLGRDLLDLGGNLAKPFDLSATDLPDMNLPMFLQNRSQYHRLGKFGSEEGLCMEKCSSGCGFFYPVRLVTEV